MLPACQSHPGTDGLNPMLANPEAKNSKGSQSSPGEDGLQPVTTEDESDF